jgi:hypothetical protein
MQINPKSDEMAGKPDRRRPTAKMGRYRRGLGDRRQRGTS